MELFRKDQNLIDTLLPELTGEEAPAIFGHNKWVPVHKALRYMVLREFTTGVRRTDCLESMGLARVVYEGVTPRARDCGSGPRSLGISPEEAVEGVSLLLDNWRRSRFLYVTSDPIFSRYHAKDDPYIQAGLLNLRDFHPKGLLLGTGHGQRYARGLIARRGASAVQALVKKWAAHPDTLDVDAAVTMLWEFLTDEAKVLRKVTLRSQNETTSGRCVAGGPGEARRRAEPGPGALHDLPADHHPARSPNSACTRHNCHGTTIDRAARPGELRRVADGPPVRDGHRRGAHGPGARRGPQQDRAGLQVQARQDQLPGRHADAGDGRQHRGPRHGPDAERPATAVELLAAGRAGGS